MQSKTHMKEFVIDMLNNNLPLFYYYHNYKHTLYVTEKAVEIGQAENCSEKELELLSIAALWHDTGYIKTYKGHEAEGCKLARQYLPEYGYTIDDIDKICGMIMATKIPQTPKNKLEEILADADLAYLGTTHANDLTQKMFKELNALNPLVTIEVWNKTEIDFLTAHRYFTGHCKKNMEPIKQAYLKSLIDNKA